jgi:hypothetical protein
MPNTITPQPVPLSADAVSVEREGNRPRRCLNSLIGPAPNPPPSGAAGPIRNQVEPDRLSLSLNS